MNGEKEMIFVGDCNQCIGGNETQQFYREIGVQDVLSRHETFLWHDRDATFKRGSRCIDYIAVSEGLM